MNALARASVLLLAAAAVSACISAPTPNVGPAPALAVSVVTDLGELGVAHHGTTTELYEHQGVNWQMLTSKQETDQRPSVHLLAYGGQTGRTYNSFVFGLAPLGAEKVRLDGAGAYIGGEIRNGVYVIALERRDVSPDMLHWTFLNGTTTVASGDGIR